jgi:hypothetical protein
VVLNALSQVMDLPAATATSACATGAVLGRWAAFGNPGLAATRRHRVASQPFRGFDPDPL